MEMPPRALYRCINRCNMMGAGACVRLRAAGQPELARTGTHSHLPYLPRVRLYYRRASRGSPA